jgi:hypothetical protein
VHRWWPSLSGEKRFHDYGTSIILQEKKNEKFGEAKKQTMPHISLHNHVKVEHLTKRHQKAECCNKPHLNSGAWYPVLSRPIRNRRCHHPLALRLALLTSWC